MAINVKSVAQFAKLFAGKSTGVTGAKIGKNMVTYMKYGDQITKTVVRADGHTITGTFKLLGGKYVPVEAVQQNANGLIHTNFLARGFKQTTVRSAANPSLSASRLSAPNQPPAYAMSNGKNTVDTNHLVFDGLRTGILNYKG